MNDMAIIEAYKKGSTIKSISKTYKNGSEIKIQVGKKFRDINDKEALAHVQCVIMDNWKDICESWR